MLYLGSPSSCSDLLGCSSVISLRFLYRHDIPFCLSYSSVSFRPPVHPALGVRNSALPGPCAHSRAFLQGLKASGGPSGRPGHFSSCSYSHFCAQDLMGREACLLALGSLDAVSKRSGLKKHLFRT